MIGEDKDANIFKPNNLYFTQEYITRIKRLEGNNITSLIKGYTWKLGLPIGSSFYIFLLLKLSENVIFIIRKIYVIICRIGFLNISIFNFF